MDTKNIPFVNSVTFLWKSTNQKPELPVSAMFVNGSRRNVHS
jgi:hypothetical protein